MATDCRKCYYAQLISEENNQFSCHRFPPQTHLIPQQHPMTGEQQLGMQSAFPVVQGDYWCGEWSSGIVE